MRQLKISSVAAAINYSIPILWVLGHTAIGVCVAVISLGLYAAVAYKTIQTVSFK